MRNPFDITQAIDLSDYDIEANWVDLPGGYRELVQPTSPMPIYILGGKGSGKTHLMRYLSCDLQLLRHPRLTPLQAVAEDGYLAVFLRCDGLNAGRFQGKGQQPDVWGDVFAYYFDLWLATTTLTKINVVLGTEQQGQEERHALFKRVAGLLRAPRAPNEQTLAGLVRWLAGFQAAADIAIDNAALTRELSVPIYASRGDLVFGIPRALVETVEALSQVKVIYLIDELENLEASQQMHINSLVRDRRPPASFRVGARLYGLRTLATYSAGEELRIGSDYDQLHLDSMLRSSKSSYATFARTLVAKRLSHVGIRGGALGEDDIEQLAESLDRHFASVRDGPVAADECRSIVGDQPVTERRYFKRLRQQLEQSKGATTALDARAIDEIVAPLGFPQHPLLEKVAILTLYSDWAAGKELKSASERIRSEALAVLADSTVNNQVGSRLKHFGRDMVAQLYRDYQRDVSYAGFNLLLAMSMGVPRNLLVLLKYAFQWAVFRGERPFSDGPISLDAQNAAVRQASNWFFDDSKASGDSGEATHSAVARLGTLLRGLRFSDKPAECSVSGVSIRTDKLPRAARDVLEDCVQMSVLVEHERGQKDRNSPRVDDKFVLNYMLCPRWDLPVASRGVLPLSIDLATAIFDPAEAGKFDELMKARLRPMNAPFARPATIQPTLPGLGE